jgi:hypothetical protein
MSFGPWELIMVLFIYAIPILILYEFVSFHRKTTRQLANIEEKLKAISEKMDSK